MAVSAMMQQYLDIKKSHQNELLFFRVGDFYEMFFEDAITASRELEITLTGKSCGLDEKAPMCGVPHHACEAYIARLVKKGYKVAIAEQMDTSDSKTLVSREIVRIVTPGTVLESNMLEESENNYICCVYIGENKTGLAFCDVSTGDFYATETVDDTEAFIINEISRFNPIEILVNKSINEYRNIIEFLKNRMPVGVDVLDDEYFDYESNLTTVLVHFDKTAPEQLGMDKKEDIIISAGVLLGYIHNTQKLGVDRINHIDIYSDQQYMNLDYNVIRNLEIMETIRGSEYKGSLLHVLDKTKTAMGKRTLRSHMMKPLINPASIRMRHDAVEELYRDTITRCDVAEAMSGIYDMQRLITRVIYGNTTPRELNSLAYTCARLPELKRSLSCAKSTILMDIHKEIDPLQDVRTKIDNAIDEDPPINLRTGGVIKAGYNAELDELRDIVSNTKEVLSRVEAKEREATGIKNLKIGFNRIFGYYIEITNSNLGQVPKEYIRKQTLVGGERFITAKLKELEEKILGASEKIIEMENFIFTELREEISLQLNRIQTTSKAIAELDVLYSFAEVSVQNGYVRPEVDLSGRIDIKGGRHPVVEQMLVDGPFVSNDVELDKNHNRVMIITGPNMAGKSTYMRQTALAVVMSQVGCFVPADSAVIGVVDRIFTRIGASDDLASGQSTFMVEMTEVANILKHATSDSLIILDEIGRGTSTYDGMSIARAVLEYIADKKKIGAKTLFATHYHELTELEHQIDGVSNYNAAAIKRGDDITFIRRMVKGAADGSYGIEVSKLAGIPISIVNRSKEILKNLEKGDSVKVKSKRAVEEKTAQMSLMDIQNQSVIKRLKDIDVETLTPIEALNFVYRIKSDLR